MSSRRGRERRFQRHNAVGKTTASETDFTQELTSGDSRTSNDTFTDHSDVKGHGSSPDQCVTVGAPQVFDSRSTEDRPSSVYETEGSTVCVVCGDKASGQYFGAVVCLPCKSFYIRCTKDGEPFFSTRCHGNCDVTKQARIRCQSCRFQKCLRAGMSRREKPERVEPSEGQYLCLVCGDLANGIHFGVFTCEGCKKFFRRGLVENKSYNCKGDNSCLINPRSRNTCRACRYRTCIEVGMSREAIKMGRPKKRDAEFPKRVKTSTYRLSVEDRSTDGRSMNDRSTDDSADVLPINSNESDSDEDIKLLEIPTSISVKTEKTSVSENILTSTEGAQKELPDCCGPQSQFVKDAVARESTSRKSWSDCSLQQLNRSPKETEMIKPVPPDEDSSSSSLSFTVTSKSEYSNLDGRSTGTEESHRATHITGQTFNPCDSDINDIPISTESPVTSVGPSSAESDIDGLYSMSSEDIDCMLRLLEDYERPKVPTVSRRRAYSSEMEDSLQWKRRRLLESNESMGNCLSSYNHYGENSRLSADQSSQRRNLEITWNQAHINQQHPRVIADSSKSKTCARSASLSQFPKPVSDSTQLETSKTKSMDLLPFHDGFVAYPELPSFKSNTLSRQSSNSASDMYSSQCNCRCWTKRRNTMPSQSSEKWKVATEVSSNDTSSKRSVEINAKTHNMNSAEIPPAGEISKAFEVLYNKLGYSQNDIYNIDRRKQTRTSVESWWGLDMDCRCIQVTGGLCFCESSPGKTSGDVSVSPPLTRIRTSFVGEPFSPYLSKKYMSQIPDSACISDVQQHVLQQLLETCLVSIADTNESGGKEESCSTTEIAALLRA